MNIRIKYLLAFLILLLCEILIGLFVNDSFVRPYIGDVLITILLHCLVRIALPKKPKLLAVYIFIFSVITELLQLINITGFLGIENKLLKAVIGTNFDPIDILCYGLGCIIITLIEMLIKNRKREKIYDNKCSN